MNVDKLATYTLFTLAAIGVLTVVAALGWLLFWIF